MVSQSVQINPQESLVVTWDLMLSEPLEAINILDLMIDEHANDDSLLGECYFQLGWAYSYKGNNSASTKYFLKAIGLFEKTNNAEKKVRALNGLGSSYVEMSLYQSALTVYSKALALASQLKQPVLTIPIHINIAAIHCELSNFNLAKERLDTLLLVINKNHLESEVAPDNWAIFHNLCAMAAWDEEDETEFNHHLEQSHDIAIKGGCAAALFVSKLLRIRLLASSSQYQRAVESYQELFSQHSIEEVGIEYFRALAEFAQLLDEGQEYSNIVQQLEPHILALEGEYYSLSTIRAKECLARSYATLGDFENAYHQLEQINAAKEWAENAEAQQHLLLAKQSSQINQLERKAASEKQLRKEVELLNKRHQIVNRIGRNISSSLDLKEIIHSLFASLKHISKVSNIAFGYCDEANKRLAFEYGVDMGKPLTPFYISLDRGVSASAKTYMNQEINILNEEELRKLHLIGGGEPMRSAIFLPVSYNNHKLGVLTIQSVHKNVFDSFLVSIIKDISNYLFISVKNGMNHQKMVKLSHKLQKEKQLVEQAKTEVEFLANHDALTQLPNRAYLQERLKKQIAASCGKSRFSFIYLNVIDFKKINNNFSYVIGDQLLSAFTQRIKDSLSIGDFFARIGADEFVIISRDEDWQNNPQRSISLIENEMSRGIAIDGSHYPISVRVVAAQYPEGGDCFDDLMSAVHG